MCSELAIKRFLATPVFVSSNSKKDFFLFNVGNYLFMKLTKHFK